MARGGAILLLLVTTLRGDDLGEARALLKSDRFADRCHAVELLVKRDDEPAVRTLEDAIRTAGRELESVSRTIDSRDAAWVKVLLRALRLELEGRDRTPEGQAARRRELELRMELEEVTKQAEVLLRTVEAGGRALARFQSPDAVARLEADVTRETDPGLRLFEIAALGGPGRSSSLPVLLPLLEHKDPRVRAAAVRAAIPLVRQPGVTEHVKALANDPAWAVRLGAYQAMAAAPFREAVGFLAEAATHERGEMAVCIDSYLEELTGRSFADAPEQWAIWWKENALAVGDGSYRRPEEPPHVERRTIASFFRIPIESEQVVFVLDFSGSMSQEITFRDPEIRKLAEQNDLPATRLGYAQAEFIRAIRALPDGARFNVIGYSNAATTMSRKMVVADDASRERAIRWVLRLSSDNLTNIWDGLQEAFGDYLNGAAGAQRFVDLPDTIMFLTDGIATRGRFRDTDALRDLVRMWNMPVDVLIHTVGIGEDHDRSLLQGLAVDTGGYYVDVDKGLREFERRRRKLPEAARKQIEPH